MTKGRNVLNVEDIEALCVRVSAESPGHVKKWFTSTFKRWLINEYTGLKRVMDHRELTNPWLDIVEGILKSLGQQIPVAAIAESVVHTVDVKEIPVWAQEALRERTPVWAFQMVSPEDKEKFAHWLDYLLTLPARDILMTVPQLITAVEAWDKQLAKQKFVSEMSSGTKIIETKAFSAGFEGQDLVLVALTTQDAYRNESAAMHNCVKTYWGRTNTKILSLRIVGEPRPLVTIEVNRISAARPNGKWGIGQIKEFANKRVRDEIVKMIFSMSVENGLAWFGQTKVTLDTCVQTMDNSQCDDEEDNEDEEEDEDIEEYVEDEEDEKPVKAKEDSSPSRNSSWSCSVC